MWLSFQCLEVFWTKLWMVFLSTKIFWAPLWKQIPGSKIREDHLVFHIKHCDVCIGCRHRYQSCCHSFHVSRDFVKKQIPIPTFTENLHFCFRNGDYFYGMFTLFFIFMPVIVIGQLSIFLPSYWLFLILCTPLSKTFLTKKDK